MDKRRVFITLILMLLVAGSWWLGNSSDTTTRPKPTTAPDFLIEGVAAKKFDALGNLRYQLTAETMRHNPEDGSTTLSVPVVDFFDIEHAPWHMTAQQGQISENGKRVTLTGGVTIDRQQSPSEAAIHITAEDLRIDPNEGYLETDNKVELSNLGSHAEAVGMQAWLKTPARIKLLSKARGYYEVH